MSTPRHRPAAFAFLALLAVASCAAPEPPPEPPPANFVLVMADDMGWGQTGYYDHPVLKTPHLDEMAAAGLRFDRFYAGAPNCSPTRATVLTGRAHDRTGVENHGYALRRQERTIARALDEVGYSTGHFGKWHLNGLRGAGAPVLASDAHHPGIFGFDTWLSVTNFFERDPLMSRNGLFVDLEGDSSEVVVAEALDFMRRETSLGNPFLAVIWYGTPHSPWIASDEDRSGFASLDERSQHHYGELVAMDRSIGALRGGLRELGIEHNTLVWFTSDNGGLPGIEPDTVGGLRGFKGSLYEGGIRVPAILEWPAAIPEPGVTKFPAVTMDILPTLASVAGLSESAFPHPLDGMDLSPLCGADLSRRETPIGFRHTGRLALIDNNLKIIANDRESGQRELFDLEADPGETKDLASSMPAELARLSSMLDEWNSSVEASARGDDYLAGDFIASENEPGWWAEQDRYKPFLEEWKSRPQLAPYIERAAAQ